MKYREVAFGAGVGGDDTFFDAVAELFAERADFETARQDIRDSTLTRGTVDTHLHTAVAATCGLPVGSTSSLRLAGRFRERKTVGRSTTLDPSGAVEPVVSSSREYGHEWSVGLAVRTLRPTLGTVTAYVHYENVRGPASLKAASVDLVRERRDREIYRLGLALERSLWSGFVLLPGFRVSHESDRRDEVREGPFHDTFRSRTDEILQDFSWGLHKSFSGFELTGSMLTNLPPSSPFVRLDAAFRL